MKCVILQPSYIPWRGYFDQIRRTDLFIFYDDTQYDKEGWRNRNRIKTANGVVWLTIPALKKGNTVNQIPINEIRISDKENWAKKHLSSLRFAYSKAPFFKNYLPLLEDFYTEPPALLADFTIDTTIALASELGITKTKFMRSSEIAATGQKTERLLSILQSVGATSYLSGPSARDYIEAEKFAAAGINLEYISYNYPEYPQLYPPFEPHVSILDLLFMTGKAAGSFIWGNHFSEAAETAVVSQTQ